MRYLKPQLNDIGSVVDLTQGGPLPKIDNDAVSGRNVDVLFEEDE